MLQTYRFLLSKELTEELYEFSKLHQHDDRKSYKEAWLEWTKESTVENLLQNERKRLSETGYEGDILDKIYKSSRYYFRKKPLVSPEPRERKDYEGLSKHLLGCIDQHIQEEVGSYKQSKDDIISISPEQGFTHFTESYKLQILEEIHRDNDTTNIITKTDIENLLSRVKKSYKNRFYKIRLQLNTQK